MKRPTEHRRGAGTDAPGGGAVADRRAPVVLVTGFGPFPGVADNPSARFAAAVDGREIGGARIVGRVIPVDWSAAWPAIEAAVAETRPDALLMYGVAVQRHRVEVERVARNVAGPRLDARGALPADEAIAPGGPSTLPCRLPWAALLGPEVGASDDAGDYLCNFVLYQAVHRLGDAVRYCGFVHLPAGDDPGALAVLTRLADRLNGPPPGA